MSASPDTRWLPQRLSRALELRVLLPVLGLSFFALVFMKVASEMWEGDATMVDQWVLQLLRTPQGLPAGGLVDADGRRAARHGLDLAGLHAQWTGGGHAAQGRLLAQPAR